MRKVVVVLLTIAGLVLAGCGPAVMPAAAPPLEDGEQFVVALPRLVIPFDANGTPSLEGLPVEQIAKSLGYPLDLSAYRIDPAVVNWMTQSGIQNIELRQTGSGLALLANGKLMPSVSYKNGALGTSAGLLRMLGPQNEQLATVLQKLTPIAERLGLSLVVKFPTKDGAAEIPLADDSVVMATPVPSDGPASAIMQFEVKYDDQGVPSIMGISARDLAAMGISAPLALHPYYVQQAQANNIQYLQFRSKGDGLHLYLNGVELPGVVWDKNSLDNTLEAAQQLYGTLPIDWNLIKQMVPLLSNTDVSILVHLPVAAGATEIPITRQ
jgi:hypothetical protein